MLCRKSRVTKSRACRKPTKSKYPVPPPPPTAVERKKHPSIQEWRLERTQRVTLKKSLRGGQYIRLRSRSQSSNSGGEGNASGHHRRSRSRKDTPRNRDRSNSGGEGNASGRHRRSRSKSGKDTPGNGTPACRTGHGQETRHLQRWRVHQADHVALLQLHLHTYQVFKNISHAFSCLELNCLLFFVPKCD